MLLFSIIYEEFTRLIMDTLEKRITKNPKDLGRISRAISALMNKFKINSLTINAEYTDEKNIKFKFNMKGL